MHSICRLFHMFVRLSVCACVHFLRYRLNIFLPLLSELRCPTFLEIQNPLRKVIERSGITFENFNYQDFLGFGATIRIGQEMLCLLYAGFFCVIWMLTKCNSMCTILL